MLANVGSASASTASVVSTADVDTILAVTAAEQGKNMFSYRKKARKTRTSILEHVINAPDKIKYTQAEVHKRPNQTQNYFCTTSLNFIQAKNLSKSSTRYVAIAHAPAEIPPEEYEEPAYQSGCKLSDGNVVRDGGEMVNHQSCKVNLGKPVHSGTFSVSECKIMCVILTTFYPLYLWF